MNTFASNPAKYSEVGVAVIPVYAWRYPTSTPAFHGVFIALRHPDAPPPTTAEWLHWQFFCQAMHTPLATIAAEPEAAMLTMQTPQPVAIHPLRLERQR
ncbi:MAG: hypothetical protein HYV02_08565 [Deltaproteobacteria bacterium]|nr:hypothetical protein [Deltaproteobacteria bacterium]